LLVGGVTGSEIGRVASGARRGEDLMAKSAQKVTLSPSRDIPVDKLVLSQSNGIAKLGDCGRKGGRSVSAYAFISSA